tara:strand:- start:39 stop:593 length:555 start_codon:yes stop_codon:yes gene_type:complete
MSFVTNTTANTVNHVTNEFYKKFVANDYIIDSTDTGGNLPVGGSNGTTYRQPLKVALGKYERIVGRIVAFFIVDADCDLQWKLTVPTAATGSKFYGTFDVSALPAAEGTAAATQGFANTVDGSATGFPEDQITGSSDGLVILKNDFTYINAGTSGDVALNISQITNHASDLVLKAGSYLQYMKF